MNQTPNYALNQWEASDRIQRADFNADNAKIDAALGARPEVVFGTYVGDGAASQEIVLGRKPKAVFVCTEYGMTYERGYAYGGLALPEAPAQNGPDPIVSLTETGFTVYYRITGTSSAIYSNFSGRQSHYAAFF